MNYILDIIIKDFVFTGPPLDHIKTELLVKEVKITNSVGPQPIQAKYIRYDLPPVQ